jgi:hypothetical protein
MTNLLMVVPTRGRPQNVRDLYQSWVDNTTGDADLLFVVDDDDPQLGTYRNQMAWMPRAMLKTVPPGLRMVGALNKVATQEALMYEAIGFMGDDHRPRTRQWNIRLCEALDHPVGITYGNDLLQGEAMPTAVVMTSNIIQALGYMAPPSMLHLCVDLVWKEWGKALGVLSYLDDVIIEHMHPAIGKAMNDAGYQMANSPEQVTRDSAAYYEYMESGFHDDVAKLRELL